MTDDRIIMRLWEPVQAYQVIHKAWGWSKSMMMAGHRLVLEIRPETRSTQQNRLLHALISDVARQKEWMGKKLPAEAWKVLFVSGHSVATKEGAELMPGLEGEFCNVRESTAHMTKARVASLIDYIQAWAAQNDVKFIESRKWMVDLDTGEII